VEWPTNHTFNSRRDTLNMSEYKYVYMHAPIAGLSKQVDCMKILGKLPTRWPTGVRHLPSPFVPQYFILWPFIIATCEAELGKKT